jgi:hypothetical protein
VLAPVLAVVSAVFASVASTSNAARHDGGRAGDGGGSCYRPPSEHTGSANSSSTQHL